MGKKRNKGKYRLKKKSISHKIISSEKIQGWLKEKLDDIFKEMYANFTIDKVEVEEILNGLTEEQMKQFMGEAGTDSGDVVCMSIGLGTGISKKQASKRMYERLRALDRRNDS